MNLQSHIVSCNFYHRFQEYNRVKLIDKRLLNFSLKQVKILVLNFLNRKAIV